MSLPTTDVSESLMTCLQSTSAPPLNYFINIRTFISKHFKTLFDNVLKCIGACPSCLLPPRLLATCDAPAS
jgi:hypothetical protein